MLRQFDRAPQHADDPAIVHEHAARGKVRTQAGFDMRSPTAAAPPERPEPLKRPKADEPRKRDFGKGVQRFIASDPEDAHAKVDVAGPRCEASQRCKTGQKDTGDARGSAVAPQDPKGRQDKGVGKKSRGTCQQHFLGDADSEWRHIILQEAALRGMGLVEKVDHALNGSCPFLKDAHDAARARQRVEAAGTPLKPQPVRTPPLSPTQPPHPTPQRAELTEAEADRLQQFAEYICRWDDPGDADARGVGMQEDERAGLLGEIQRRRDKRRRQVQGGPTAAANADAHVRDEVTERQPAASESTVTVAKPSAVANITPEAADASDDVLSCASSWQHVDVERPATYDAYTFPQKFPPTASTTGKRYYAFRPHHECGPVVACGQSAALRLLGGSWKSRGGAPQGFAGLEDAVSNVLREFGVKQIIPRVGSHELAVTLVMR